MSFWYFFTIPTLPAEVSHQSNEVQVEKYLCKEGDGIMAGTPIADVSNYWALMRLKANGRGTVQKTFFSPGTHVKIADPIAIIAADGEDLPGSKECSIVEVIEVKREKPKR